MEEDFSNGGWDVGGSTNSQLLATILEAIFVVPSPVKNSDKSLLTGEVN